VRRDVIVSMYNSNDPPDQREEAPRDDGSRGEEDGDQAPFHVDKCREDIDEILSLTFRYVHTYNVAVAIFFDKPK